MLFCLLCCTFNLAMTADQSIYLKEAIGYPRNNLSLDNPINLRENDYKSKIQGKERKLIKEISFNRQTNNFMPCRDNKIFIFEGDKKEYCKIKD